MDGTDFVGPIGLVSDARRRQRGQNIREVLVVCALHNEGLCGEIGAPRKKFTGQPSPCEFVVFSIRDLIVSTLFNDALPQAQ